MSSISASTLGQRVAVKSCVFAAGGGSNARAHLACAGSDTHQGTNKGGDKTNAAVVQRTDSPPPNMISRSEAEAAMARARAALRRAEPAACPPRANKGLARTTQTARATPRAASPATATTKQSQRT